MTMGCIHSKCTRPLVSTVMVFYSSELTAILCMFLLLSELSAIFQLLRAVQAHCASINLQFAIIIINESDVGRMRNRMFRADTHKLNIFRMSDAYL